MKTERFEKPCTGCLLGGCKTKLKGSTKADILVVVRPPHDEKQARSGKVLDAAGMKVFSDFMEEQGFERDDFAFINGVRCGYDPKEHPAADRRLIEKHCREWLLRTIEYMKPKVVIPLGAEAAKQVEGRPVKITKVRGQITENRPLNTLVLPMLDPFFVHKYEQHQNVFRVDCNTLGALVDNDYDLHALQDREYGEYRFVNDLQHLIDNPPEELSFDIETVGKWFEDDSKILTMQFCVEAGKADMLVWDHPDRPMPRRNRDKVKRQLRQVLQNPNTSVFGQNNKYDRIWAQEKFGIRYRIDHDTIMLAAIVDENMLTKNQDDLVKRFVPEMAGYADEFNQMYDKGRMDLIPIDELLKYGCGDVDANFRLLPELLDPVAEDNGLWAHYRHISIPGINAFCDIEPRGMLVDEDALDDLEEELVISQAAARKSLLSQVHRDIKRKHASHDKDLKKSWSFTRAGFLIDILFKHKKGFRLKPRVFTEATEKLKPSLRVPSTSTKDHLPYFYDDCPFTLELSEYIKANRVLTANIQSFKEKYIYDGVIYPSYQLWVAVTGRTSSRDPNGQNIPKRGKVAKAYRRIFYAPEGYVILEADLSQAELRISADMADDKTMLRIYRQGGDIHAVTAASTMGMTLEKFYQLPKDEQGLARFKAKAINFGFIYGMGWRNFIVYAKTQYGVEFTDKEAEAIRNKFFDTYDCLHDWHNAMRELAKREAQVRSYSGRIRHLPMINSSDDGVAGEAQRQAINSPVQEFASSLGVMSIGRLNQEVDPTYLAPTGFVHDAIYARVPLEYLEWGAKTLKYYMESNDIKKAFRHKMKCPIVADVGFGPNGAEVYEMGGLDLDKPFDFDSIDDLEMDIPEQLTPPNNGRIEVPEYLRIYT